ncbi:Disease resistance protein At4g27190 [Euphorbia peplus]|nr:Disease resistance protein At4g27190 [Euphorbia peplus]
MEPLCGAILTSAMSCGVQTCCFMTNERDEAEKLEDNWRNLQRADSSLNAKKQDIEAKITENDITKKTTKQWDNWVKEVKEIGEEVKNLEKKHKRATRFHYITCRFRSLAKLSRNMATKADEIYRLANRMKDDLAMTDKLVANPSPSFRKTPEPAWVKKNVDQIMKFLKEEDVKKIGVWAFAGMGKTTIMESLKDNLLGSGLFELVLFVTVGEEDSEERTRQSILEQLKLNTGRTGSSQQTALVISSALKEKKYLLILDQVSQEMDFRNLGIDDDHMKGKVVLATRYKTVCDKLKMDESWELKQMSEDDARMLFREIVGEIADHKSKKYDAELIVKECGGIPLLINAVATYLKDANDEVWFDCTLKLQSSTYDDLEPFSDSYNIFKVVYGGLLHYRKKCFLYGALYPEDYEIYEDHLMECWRAEQFIPHAGTSNNAQIFQRARLEGHATIKSLIDACLLKRCKKMNYVTMPYLFRTWALKTDEGGSALVKPMNDWEKYQSAKWISLKCEDLSTLLEHVNFSGVTTLFLQRNEMRRLTLDPFFLLKSKLRVVDLGYSSIRSLPSSIVNLIHLKALYLNNCGKLSELPADIKELKHVEILDICQTGISHWPAEIGSMLGLRCLRVSFSRNVGNYSHTQVPAENVIGRLSSLEELTIVVDEDYQNQWNGIFMDDKWNNVVQGITKEVATLKYLTTLRIYFPSLKCLEDFIKHSKSWENADSQRGDRSFRSFKIVVGSFWRHHEIDIGEHKANRHLKFFAYNESSTADGCCSTISKVLTQACTFELIGHRTLAHLSKFSTDSLEGLKVCAIKDCKQMSSVICGNYNGDAVLKELKQLHLINLRNLACICDDLAGEGSFANLTTLKIDNCPALTVILSSKIIQRMTSLEHLRVENCLETTVITEGCEQQENNPSTTLPRLKSLELINLPKIDNICHNLTLKWNALQAIEVYKCPKLQSFSLILKNADSLRLIKCENSWWNQLDLESDVRNRFQSFCQFISRVEINAAVV